MNVDKFLYFKVAEMALAVITFWFHISYDGSGLKTGMILGQAVSFTTPMVPILVRGDAHFHGMEDMEKPAEPIIMIYSCVAYGLGTTFVFVQGNSWRGKGKIELFKAVFAIVLVILLIVDIIFVFKK